MKSWKRKKEKFSFKIKAVSVLCFFIIFIILFLIYLANIVSPVILQASEAKIKSLTQKAMSRAVYSIIMSETDTYSELLNYTYDEEGSVSLITVNSIYVNMLSRQITSLAQSSIDNLADAGIDINLGAFTGITALADAGPFVKMKLNAIGTVSTFFRSEFLSAGINQTNHRIYINLRSVVSVILPINSPQVNVATEVIVGETIIVGKIPSTYLQSSNLDEMLNLVPH
ncbi:MAG: sporulation protein YunB [Clostridia bacterium]|nr:sporulation protein YunB [Clostridia bacterium]MDD3862777.1 sporulation protein YunB [Clostridia bacterium]MDD4408817.1 sporulation protein YunB [Clostridia bacterium]